MAVSMTPSQWHATRLLRSLLGGCVQWTWKTFGVSPSSPSTSFRNSERLAIASRAGRRRADGMPSVTCHVNVTRGTVPPFRIEYAHARAGAPAPCVNFVFRQVALEKEEEKDRRLIDVCEAAVVNCPPQKRRQRTCQMRSISRKIHRSPGSVLRYGTYGQLVRHRKSIRSSIGGQKQRFPWIWMRRDSTASTSLPWATMSSKSKTCLKFLTHTSTRSMI